MKLYTVRTVLVSSDYSTLRFGTVREECVGRALQRQPASGLARRQQAKPVDNRAPLFRHVSSLTGRKTGQKVQETTVVR